MYDNEQYESSKERVCEAAETTCELVPFDIVRFVSNGSIISELTLSVSDYH
jgi:hypothetical protein